MPFDGTTYSPPLDRERLTAQFTRVFETMSKGGWFTLARLSDETGDPEASVSARIRDFRKEKFGGHTVHTRRTTDGLWYYKLEAGDE